MNDTAKMTVSFLQKRATHCRRLSRCAVSPGIAAELERLADEYDRDVARLHHMPPDSIARSISRGSISRPDGPARIFE